MLVKFCNDLTIDLSITRVLSGNITDVLVRALLWYARTAKDHCRRCVMR
jgi:hypothetical protein